MTRAVQSMTGFARSEGRLGAPTPLAWVWEARSVNNKGLDVRLRVPPGFESLDPGARQIVAESISRGSVSFNLTITVEQDTGDVRINEPLLDRLIGLAAEKAKSLPAGISPAQLDGLMSIKGVIEAHTSTVAAEAAAARDRALLDGLKRAVADLNRARHQEGDRLVPIIKGQLATIADLVGRAGASAAAQPETLKAKLGRQIAELGDSVPALTPERFAQEVALLLVKGDIREEIDRLTAHIAQARDLIAQGGPCGRRLDFLSQEFNREANTLCSKSQDVALTRIGLDLKATIDQFREQIQNLE